jgi:ketose-bisphosphate aldolase
MINVALELKKARAHGYAMPAFNTNNLEVTKAICLAAAKFDLPILIATTPGAIEYAGLKNLFDIVTNEINTTGIKAAIHLDHAKEFTIIKQAVDIGYPSIMFDGSTLDFDENVAMTEKVVEYAHTRGVAVEAEIGVIGREEGGKLSHKAVYSAPEQVLRFVQETGIDSVAVSVGNEHGAPEGETLDLNLLREIADVVEIPLVLHGSSGLSSGDIREAISLGIAKINIDTNIRKAFVSAIESSHETDYRKTLTEGMDEVEKVVEHYIKLLGGK